MPEDNLKYNQTAVSDFVERMSDNTKNALAVFLLLTRQTKADFNQLRYSGRIANNLVEFDDIRLGRAKGLVTGHFTNSAFRFYPKGPKVGNIEIIHPPVIYDNTDKELLRGIIIHELRHAQDFSKGLKIYTVNDYEFDAKTYIYSLSEARAWADQLNSLVSRIGSPEKVLQALNQQPKWVGVPDTEFRHAKKSPFRLPPELLQAAQGFLKNFNFHESMAAWAAAPVLATSLLFPQMNDKVKQQAVQAVEVDKNEINTLVDKIFNKLLFKNFVIKA